MSQEEVEAGEAGPDETNSTTPDHRDETVTEASSMPVESAEGASVGGDAMVVAQDPASARKLKWYVVHTYSGFENKAKKSLEERAKLEGLEEYFGEVLVPTESVIEVLGGAKRTSKRKFFPGYMLVQMELNDRTWHIVKATPKITGFVGNARNPVPVREAEVLRLTQQIDQGTLSPKPKISFEEGENIRVIDGPFSSFNGVVEEVKPEKQKVRVLVSIFGRATPVELDFGQVEKAAQ